MTSGYGDVCECVYGNVGYCGNILYLCHTDLFSFPPITPLLHGLGEFLYSLTKVQNFYLSGKQLVIKNQTISRRSLNNWFVVKKQR